LRCKPKIKTFAELYIETIQYLDVYVRLGVVPRGELYNVSRDQYVALIPQRQGNTVMAYATIAAHKFKQLFKDECYLDRPIPELIEASIFGGVTPDSPAPAHFFLYHHFITVLVLLNKLKTVKQEELIRLQLMTAVKEYNLEIQSTSERTS
jgi:hypothetical protein